MRLNNQRAHILGYYIKPNRKRPNKGIVFDKTFISPCLPAGMGGGGNIVPTILEVYENE